MEDASEKCGWVGVSCCCCFSLCGTFGFIVGCCFFIAAATDRRTPNIEAFNAAMASSEWTPADGASNSTLQTSFKNLQMSAKVTWGASSQTSRAITLTGTTTRLGVDGSDEDKAFVDSANLQDYVFQSSATYQINFNPPMQPSVCEWESSLHLLCEPSDTVGLAIIVDGQTMNVPTQFMKQHYQYTHHEIGDVCPPGHHYDMWTTKCTEYTIVNKLCLKLVYVKTGPSTGNWKLDGTTSPSGATTYGCGKAAAWDPRSKMDTAFVDPQSDLTNTNSLSIEVYASEGPTVEFYKVMGAGSSLSFGRTQAEDLLIGAILTGAGGVWSVCFGVAIFVIVLQLFPRLRSIVGRKACCCFVAIFGDDATEYQLHYEDSDVGDDAAAENQLHQEEPEVGYQQVGHAMQPVSASHNIGMFCESDSEFM